MNPTTVHIAPSMLMNRLRSVMLMWLLTLCSSVAWGANGVPVLLITSSSNNFTQYYSEILHAEGLNEFDTADVSAVTAATLASYDIAIVGQTTLTAAQAAMFSAWVNGGGNLIAMRPDSQLATLLGLTATGGTLAEGYVLAAQSGPGLGIVPVTMQFHDTADLYTTSGAKTLATLYAADGMTPTLNPAVTLISVGSNGGQAAAFTYDLAKSVVYTHQGNPAYAHQSRDGATPIRAYDLLYPTYLDFNKLAIPQADEQQRLLANLITQMNLSRKPLPRFWYLPNGLKAAIVHALDDHSTPNGTQTVFDRLYAASPAGCSAPDWQCFRGTAWIYYTNIGLTAAQAQSYVQQGHEVGAHVRMDINDTNDCPDYTSYADLDAKYAAQLPAFATAFPNLPPQTTHRFHCIVWSDWLTQAKVARAHGIRYNMDYFWYPDAWIQGRQGFMRGSGIPMRFADVDGTIIDSYQGASDFVNLNTTQSFPAAMGSMLARAVGPEGYYGLFGTHDDFRNTSFVDGAITTALAFGVPIVTAQQALQWLDGRNTSTFSGLSWDGTHLGFTIAPGTGAQDLQAMLPLDSASYGLGTLTNSGSPVTYTTQTIKGIQYAFFAAAAGTYVATYNAPYIPAPAGGLTLWPTTTIPTTPYWADTNPVEIGFKFTSDRNGQIAGIRFYKAQSNNGPHVVNLWDSSGHLMASANSLGETASGWQQVNFQTPVAITSGMTYVASYHTNTGYAADGQYFTNNGIDNAPLHAPSDSSSGGNGVYVYGPSAFPTSTYNATNYWVDVVFADYPPKSLWGNDAMPANRSGDPYDPGSYVLGVKFSSDMPGKIVGMRFYKGPLNTGTHTGTLWTADGTPMASATFTNETSGGWQQVLFSTPVDITPGATYVASYNVPPHGYSYDTGYFSANYDNPPLHAPATTSSGGNGVLGTSGFPSNSANGTNYWVDVLFVPKQ